MVAKSASLGHGSLVCGLWLAGGGRGGSVPTYVLGTFYIRVFMYESYDLWKIRKTNCTIHVFMLGPVLEKCQSGKCRTNSGKFRKIFVHTQIECVGNV